MGIPYKQDGVFVVKICPGLANLCEDRGTMQLRYCRIEFNQFIYWCVLVA